MRWRPPECRRRSRASVPRYQEATALVLALASLLLGIAAFGALDLIQIGRPDAADVGGIVISLSDVFSAPAVLKSLAPVLLGAALAIGLSRQEREQIAPCSRRRIRRQAFACAPDAVRPD